MPNPEDFDIDALKKTWQDQKISDGYNQDDIEVMLNRKSRNYVKYILWISVAEFIIFGLVNFLALFSTDFHNDFTNILNKLQIRNQSEVEFSIDKIYNWMKVLSLVVTGIFVVVFYVNYKKIDIESNLKKFIIHILKFKKTVNLFIFSNVFLLVLFIGSLVSLLTITIRRQNIHVDNPTFWSLIFAVVLSLLISVVLILLYYKLAYGILLKRLTKNLKQLEKIDSEKEL